MSKYRQDFFQKLPKIELHAHINGSISPNTMKKLLELKRSRFPDWTHPGLSDHDTAFQRDEKRSLQRCFEMFALIHQISDSDDAAYIITKDIIKEFADDNVKYLELRTTPRNVPATGMTKRSYVSRVLQAIDECHTDNDLDIDVRLMLAIDRRTTAEDAVDTVDIAAEFMQKSGGVVVGVDLSGDPFKGDARAFMPAFEAAKSKGLRLALHVAEETDHKADETLALLSLPPDRIGHGTFIHQGAGVAEERVALVNKYNIPIEICPSSNVITQTVSSVDKHHFGYWYSRKHPLTICTDDKGVFSTSLSEELQLIAETFNLSQEDIWNIVYNSIDYIFADDEIKHKLRKQFDGMKEECLKMNS